MSSNKIKNDLQIHLVLVDSDETSSSQDSEPMREYSTIVVSEAEISGFKGLQKKEQLDIDEDESDSISIQLDLVLKWQIDSQFFETSIPDPVVILRKLPGAMFQLGNYYWHFYRDFYRWAATECLDQDTRYCGEFCLCTIIPQKQCQMLILINVHFTIAIQCFHELSVCLPTQVHVDDMAPIFAEMYRGRYPSPELLTTLNSEAEYVAEPLSIMDNIIFVFPALSHNEQINFLTRLQ